MAIFATFDTQYVKHRRAAVEVAQPPKILIVVECFYLVEIAHMYDIEVVYLIICWLTEVSSTHKKRKA